ncbi:hypothetical protein DOTSEDRAFT_172491 [Dothistroma septosporum NZE10]|uniref:Zn(2)-C6 fungal-type domain-containing protein n=1 Tax=Dothistroma septosporum (strain NZE10 / CBS 128990) TaxID=675120 RepID=N1PLW1_DOTSN|nr:hypothetical protein DOTSEDRAFT_172491 [Dothistroma septosporum NZE10]
MPAQRRHARLKDSCDHCSVAKVRCTKEKPSCSRCHLRAIPCGYSYSRRAGRRSTSRTEALDMPSPIEGDTTPSAASTLDDSEPAPSSPESIGGIMGSPTSWAPVPAYSWEQGLYQAQCEYFQQHRDHPAASDYITAAPADPSMPMLNSGFASPPPPFQAPAMARNFSTSSTASMSSEYYAFSDSSDSSAHSQTEAVQDELSKLSNFAESMERKFDAVVRSRLQSRDSFSEFGMPLGELEIEDAGVPAPDVSELAFYYSLAELKRRLKWVSEDVSYLISNPC